MPPGFTDLRLDPDTTIHGFHPVGGDATGVDCRECGRAEAGVRSQKVRIQATIAGYNSPAAKKTATLILNGKTLGTKTVDVPANGRGQVGSWGLDNVLWFNKCEVAGFVGRAGVRMTILFLRERGSEESFVYG